MDYKIDQKVLDYLEQNKQFLLDKTIELAKIPAPLGGEQKRAEWVKAYLEGYGAKGVYIDDALNCVWPLHVEGCDDIVVLMAHTDVVFPDTTELPIEIRGDKIYGPGIGDDTGNLATMLLIARYIAEHRLAPKTGVLFVANSGEEGLGNLKGSRQILKDYAGRIREVVSFDGVHGFVANDAVGSHRIRVTVKTEGGHSFAAFGNRNAIHYLASMITTLYTMKVPPYGLTTYNVGGIEGGTSINTIAQSASMLYEFRSSDRRSLAIMEEMFGGVVEAYRKMGVEVEVEVLGVRPCRGEIDLDKLEALTKRAQGVAKHFTGIDFHAGPSSTDANIPLSMGVPGIAFGLIYGEKAHTREEWLKLDTLYVGAKIAAWFILDYFN